MDRFLPNWWCRKGLLNSLPVRHETWSPVPVDGGIPASPKQTYADKGWSGYGDWLGTGRVANQQRKYLAFEEARSFARHLGLRSTGEWNMYCKGSLPEKGTLPVDIPGIPSRVYADTGWAGMGDWLGTGNVAPTLRTFRSFKEARTFARSLGLNSGTEWKEYCKGNFPKMPVRPPDIPSNPNKTYADKGWAGMRDWLGTEKKRASKSKRRD